MLTLLGPAAVWEFGVELPARRIDSGVEGLEGVEKEITDAALGDVWLNTDDTASFMVDSNARRKVSQSPAGQSVRGDGRETRQIFGAGKTIHPLRNTCRRDNSGLQRRQVQVAKLASGYVAVKIGAPPRYTDKGSDSDR